MAKAFRGLSEIFTSTLDALYAIAYNIYVEARSDLTSTQQPLRRLNAMATFVFVSRDDLTLKLNKQIEREYPGTNFDFSGAGLPQEWVSGMHEEGFSVEAVYTQSDSGDWGTFVQVEKDFSIEEPDSEVSDLEWEKYEENLALLEKVVQEWAEKFVAEVLANPEPSRH